MTIDQTLAWLGQEFQDYQFFGRTCTCETDNVITVEELVNLAKEDLMHKCVKCNNEIEPQLRYHNEERPLGWYPLNEDEYNEHNFSNTGKFLPLTGEENETLNHLRNLNILDEETYKESVAKLKKILKNDGEERETLPETKRIKKIKRIKKTKRIKKEIIDIKDAESSSIDTPGKMGFMYSSPNWSIGVRDFERGKPAYNRIYNTNEFAADSQPGMEHVCLYVKVERIGPGDGELSVGIYDWWWKIVGERKTIHTEGTSFTGTPMLKGELMVGGSAEGWITRECYEGEKNLIALVESPDSTPTQIWIQLE